MGRTAYRSNHQAEFPLQVARNISRVVGFGPNADIGFEIVGDGIVDVEISTGRFLGPHV
jgi:hypothetical protein